MDISTTALVIIFIAVSLVIIIIVYCQVIIIKTTRLWAKEPFANLWDENRKLKFRLILEKLKDLTDNNIYAFYGTHLGIIRHGDVIPWDDDIDMAMSEEDFKKYAPILRKEMGLKHVMGSLWKVRANGTAANYPNIDIFVEKRSGGTIMLNDDNRYYDVDSIYPLKESTLIGVEGIKYPRTTKPLFKLFGPNCLTECKSGVYNHELGLVNLDRTTQCHEISEVYGYHLNKPDEIVHK